MPHHTCCNKQRVKRGLWSPEEDEKLINYISTYGHGCWSTVPRLAGLQRCGKSCRLRWINYLRPDLKRGNFTPQEAALIIQLHRLLGNRWAQIAKNLPGRTDNEVKNFWNSNIKKMIMAHHNMSEFSQNLRNSSLSASSNNLVIPNPQIEQNPPFLGFDSDPLESRMDHLVNYGANSTHFDWPIFNPPLFDQTHNQDLKQDDDDDRFMLGSEFIIPKQEILDNYYQDSAFLDALKPEFEYGVSYGPGSGFGPLHPNHIKNISCLMASFAAPPPPTAAAYLPPLPGSYGMNPTPSRWGPLYH